MRYLLLFYILFLCCSQIMGFAVPYSLTPVQNESNSFTSFVKVSPDTKEPVLLDTKCWVWHDMKNMIFLFECKIDGNFTEGLAVNNDDDAKGDYVRIQLVTSPNDYFGYLVAVFPRGTYQDGIRNSDLGVNFEWDSNCTTESKIVGDLWSCKITFPFTDMRIFGKPPYKWKLNVSRRIFNTSEVYASPYCNIGDGKIGYFSAFADLEIKENIEKPKNYKIQSYLVRTYDLLNKTMSYDPENVGLDLLYRPTSNSSFKATFNPDFSDVPPDNETGAFNYQFAPMMNENRFFFTEDLDAFKVPTRLFYTRNIMKPQYAFKFTGNTKNLAFGAFNAVDKKTDYNSDDQFSLLALRPQTDIANVQFTVLERKNSSQGYKNNVMYMSPEFTPNRLHVLNGRYAYSRYYDKNTPLKTGFFANSYYRLNFADYAYNFSHDYVSKNFMADMGIINLKNKQEFNVNAEHVKNINKEIVRSFNGTFGYNISMKDAPWKQNSLYYWWFEQVTFKSDWNISLNMGEGYESARGVKVETNDLSLNLNHYHFATFNFGGGANYGRRVIWGAKVEDSTMFYINDGRNVFSGSLYVNGNFAPHLSYFTSFNYMKVYQAKKNWLIDSECSDGNGEVTVLVNKKLSLTTGIRYSFYEVNGIDLDMGLYSNLKYEYNTNLKIYAGLNNSRFDYNDQWINSSKNLYVKFSYSI